MVGGVCKGGNGGRGGIGLMGGGVCTRSIQVYEPCVISNQLIVI